MRLACLAAITSLSLAFVAPASLAQNRPELHAAFDPGLLLLANVRQGTKLETYQSSLLNEFRAADADGNGLDWRDVERIEQAGLDQSTARGRAKRSEIEAGFAKLDADGNGGVSLAELLVAMGAKPDQSAKQKQFERTFAAADKDGNGLLSVDELIGLTRSVDPRMSKKIRDRFSRVLALDPNRDGSLTEAELVEVFRRQFARIDMDADGLVSPGEFASAGRLIGDAHLIAELPVCAVPSPQPGSQAVAFATASGQQLSPVAVGGQDRETGIFDVTIEPGGSPLYVMVSAQDPTIWNLTGEIERIERLVVFSFAKDESGAAMAAVAGLPESKVFFAEPGCLPVHRLEGSNHPKGQNASLVFSAIAGSQATGDARPGSNATVALPSLTIGREQGFLPAPAGFDKDTWFLATATWPRGIGHIDPARLVSKTMIEPYAQMPGEIGIAKLVAEGVLKPTENLNEYRIVKPLARFPARSTDASGTSYVLSTGIALPSGKHGNGCVYAPNGRVIVPGDHCIRSLRRDMVQMRVDQTGKACLYRGGVKEAGCFTDDGRPLRPKNTPQGQVFVPGKAKGGPLETLAPPEVVNLEQWARPWIEIIPVGLTQRW